MALGFNINVHLHEPTINLKVQVDPIELRVVFPTIDQSLIAWRIGPVSNRPLE